QYSRAIENYDLALAKDRAKDPTILACLGRVWLMRGKQEKSLQAMKTALDYSQSALSVAPEQIHFKFNVAFVQIQIAQLIHALGESARQLSDVEAAAQGLDEAIDAFSAIARSPNPPFPKHDIEQRANMGRNTMRKQLERAVQSQREYEERNASRLQAAREQREGEIRKREEEKRRAVEAAEEQRRVVAEERRRMQERDRELAEQRAEEDRRREELEMTTDEETGERRKRVKKKAAAKRKKKGEESDVTDGEGTDGGTRDRQRSEATTGTPAASGDEERPRKKKKRKLERKSERKSKNEGKFKSKEIIEDSDEDDDDLKAMAGNAALAKKVNSPAAEEDEEMEDEEDEVVRPRKKVAKVIDEDEDDDEEGEEREREDDAANGDLAIDPDLDVEMPDGDEPGVTAAGDADHGGDAVEPTGAAFDEEN
ncbi:hypothetical protein LTS18_011957, partial [Coniosporium uncinatum]